MTSAREAVYSSSTELAADQGHNASTEVPKAGLWDARTQVPMMLLPRRLRLRTMQIKLPELVFEMRKVFPIQE